MGFDTGLLLANLLMSYFSQPGHSNSSDDQDAAEQYALWLSGETVKLFETFEQTFIDLWKHHHNDHVVLTGYAYEGGGFDNNPGLLDSANSQWMSDLWLDTLGFTGIELIRRIVGIAHVADLKDIPNQDIRGDCEKRCLSFARVLMMYSKSSNQTLLSIRDVMEEARKIYYAPAPTSWVVN